MKDKEMIEEMAQLIKLPIENWLEDTGAISPATTYYAELIACINDSAEVLYNEGYRKETDGSVVLSKDAWASLQEVLDGKCDFCLERERKETAKKFKKTFVINLLNNSVIDECTLEELEFDGADIKEALNDTLKQFGVEVKE